MSKVPISLIIDDGGVVNTFHFHDIGKKHELLVPPAFAMLFGKICARYGVKGKFSIVPVPAGLGRLDEKDNVNMVPAGNIEAFVKYAKEYIQPRFSITPELLTHFLAWNPVTRRNLHVCEDAFVSSASAEKIADYLVVGMEILCNLGLAPSGVSSPWKTGIDNEDNYARGIGMACKRALGLDRSFYFLHSREDGFFRPKEMCNSSDTGRVITIPNNTIDAFWGTMNPADTAQAIANARAGIDSLISEDGRSGKLRELYDAGEPMVMITHWQSLYSDGRAIGLEGFEHLLQRIEKIFGNNVEWVNFEELSGIYCP